jgi:hypothetical protein
MVQNNKPGSPDTN